MPNSNANAPENRMERHTPSTAQALIRKGIVRIRSDIRLAIVTLYCVCSFSLITPFAIYRFAVGDFLIGAVDLAIVVVFVFLMLLAWIPGKTQLGANLTACAATIAGMAVILALNVSYLWVFSALVSNFLMADRRVALLTSLLLILAISNFSQAFDSGIERFTFAAVAVMVSLFSLIFSHRVDTRHGHLTEMAALDGLTGAFNRRTLDQDHETIAVGADNRGRPACLAIMDLDNFKRLNDVHGHDAGDHVLIRLTEIVNSSTRDSDRFYRYGGEEFVLVLPGTTLVGARVAMNNLIENIATSLQGPDGMVTLSIGVAEYQQLERVESWLKRADNALLEAKRTGKNRLVEA